MRKTHGRSIALGIGIGMIITSIAGMIFTTGTKEEMTKEEIISLAKSYGMIEKTPLIIPNSSSSAISGNSVSLDTTKDSTKGSTNDNIKDSDKDSTKDSANDSTNDTTKDSTNNGALTGASIDKSPTDSEDTAQNNSSMNNQRNIQIVIADGAKSQHVIRELLEKGIITSERDMIATFDKYNASTKINIGKFMFKKNEDLDYIVKTICGIK